uniref:Uncharacterized protein n=1 Tax=Balaenoptera musculus TaxID=9771 RepID=A0A8C0HUD1_BALMU
MAEASVAGASAAAAVAARWFFCHFCKGEVSPKLPEYICPRCESGSTEERLTVLSWLHSTPERTPPPLIPPLSGQPVCVGKEI